MKSIKKFILVLVIMAAGVFLADDEAQAQWVLLSGDAHKFVTEGLDQMYNLEYVSADSTFNKLVAEYPDHPAGYFLLALVDWWRIMPNIDVESKVERYSESFHKRIERTLEVCEQRLDTNPLDIVGLFFKGSALGYRARLAIQRNFSIESVLSLYGAAQDGRKAYNTLLQCQQLAPSNSDILLGSGIFNYMAAYIPERYPQAAPLLGFLPPGDKRLGLRMLELSAKDATYASVEAKYTLLEIFSNEKMEKNYGAALAIAKELHEKYPMNSVFHKFLAKNYYMTSKFSQADTVWEQVIRRVKQRQPGYELTLARQALYYLGDIKLRTGKPADAVKILKHSVTTSNRLDDDDETGWLIMSYLKMGNAYDVLKKRDDAVEQYREVLSMRDYNESHAKARQYIREPYR